MDSREWGEGSPPVIVAVNRAAKVGEKIYVVGEAKHLGEEGWWWAQQYPTDYGSDRIYPEFWQPLPEPPQSETRHKLVARTDCRAAKHPQRHLEHPGARNG